MQTRRTFSSSWASLSNLIFRCQFGSHVYGTNLPTSDLDFKSVFLPSAEEILLQRVPDSRHTGTKTDERAKNAPGDIDDESFSLQKFVSLLCEGQTVALDMLFAPSTFVLKNSKVWEELVANREKFLHSGTSAFVGYTRAQAAKYGVKGFRVAAVKAALQFLADEHRGHPGRLSDIKDSLRAWVTSLGNEHVRMIEIAGAQGGMEPALEVCGRKIPMHAGIGYTYSVLTKIYDNYGARAKLAESNEGVDWKALMHAVRVAREAEELLRTGNIQFPRPERELLLQIRQGQKPYAEVAEIIEEGLTRVALAQEKSTLPKEPNRKWADEFVMEAHLESLYYDGFIRSR